MSERNIFSATGNDSHKLPRRSAFPNIIRRDMAFPPLRYESKRPLGFVALMLFTPGIRQIRHATRGAD